MDLTGDGRPIGELLEQEPWLYRVARRLVQDDAAAQDLVQSTWLAALENPPADLSRPRAWLQTVIARQAGKRRARRSPVLLEDVDRQAEPGVEPDLALLREEGARALRAAVERLDEPLRRTVLLIYQDGLRQAAAARELGITPRAVRMRLAQAHEKLKRLLGEGADTRDGSWALGLAPLVADPARRGATWSLLVLSVGVVGPLALAGAVLVALAIVLGLALGGRGDGDALAGPPAVAPSTPAAEAGGEPAEAPGGGADQPPTERQRVPVPAEGPAETADPGPPAADAEEAAEEGPQARYWVHGRVQIEEAAPEGWRAGLVAEVLPAVETPPELTRADLDSEGGFRVGANAAGRWRLRLYTADPQVRIDGGVPEYYRFVDFPYSGDEPAYDLDVPETTTVTVLVEGLPRVRLRRAEDPDGWRYGSVGRVEDGRARFSGVPPGIVEILHRRDDGTYLELGTRRIDVGPEFGPVEIDLRDR